MNRNGKNNEEYLRDDFSIERLDEIDGAVQLRIEEDQRGRIGEKKGLKLGFCCQFLRRFFLLNKQMASSFCFVC